MMPIIFFQIINQINLCSNLYSIT